LTQTDAKQAWKLLRDKGELAEVHVDERTLWRLKSDAVRVPDPAKHAVRLLPAFDTLILGYADRNDVVAPEHQHEVYHGGQTVPVVLVDGLAAGVWRYKRQGKRLSITVHLFEPVASSIKEVVAEEAEAIGRFWGAKISIAYSAHPV
jgi:hypothetical protein